MQDIFGSQGYRKHQSFQKKCTTEEMLHFFSSMTGTECASAERTLRHFKKNALLLRGRNLIRTI